MSEDTLTAYVTAAVWLWDRDEHALALAFRDDCVNDVPEWREEVVSMWNAACDRLIDYADRNLAPGRRAPSYAQVKVKP